MSRFKIAIFAIILCVMNATFCHHFNSNWHRKVDVFRSSDRYLDKIKMALDYVKENVDDLNLDAYFGVLLAKSYLENIKFESRKLDDVLMLSDAILKSAENLNLDNYRYLKNIKKYFMNKENWKALVHFCGEKFNCDLNQNTFFYELLSQTSPNERESDICLSEIIGEGQRNNKSCNISNMCYKTMIIGPSMEYSKTHRLLYFLICRTKNCDTCGGRPTTLSIKKLCCSIMNEISTLEKLKFPIQSRDLFMEQVVLCAMSGYVEILKPKWIELVKLWQRPEGCWGSYDRRWKRSNSSLGPANCSSHSTGLGIALLAIAFEKSLCVLDLD